MEQNRAGILRDVMLIGIILIVLVGLGTFGVWNITQVMRSLDTLQIQAAWEEIIPQQKPKPPIAPANKAAPVSVAKKAELKSVRFFEAGKDVPVPKARAYSAKFAKQQIRYIYTELTYKNNGYQIADADFPVIVQYYSPTGQLLADLKRTAKPKKEWASAMFVTGWGKGEAGSWVSGQYTAKIYIDGEPAREYQFTIN